MANARLRRLLRGERQRRDALHRPVFIGYWISCGAERPQLQCIANGRYARTGRKCRAKKSAKIIWKYKIELVP